MCTAFKGSPKSMPNQTTRRTFLKLTTAAASVTAIEFSHAVPTANAVALFVDPGLALTTSESVEWAAGQFRQALTDKGIRSSTTGSSFTVIVSPVYRSFGESVRQSAQHY
jgi:hypothetical protein